MVSLLPNISSLAKVQSRYGFYFSSSATTIITSITIAAIMFVSRVFFFSP